MPLRRLMARSSSRARQNHSRAANGDEIAHAALPDVKLVIQLPCLNEREQLADTLADLPRHIEGFDEIEVLVVDDGSTDGTSQRAAELGVHHIVRFPAHRGLAAAFVAGIDAALRLGADVIVNTDADNQYRGSDVARIVAPIQMRRADVVIGDRQIAASPHFSAAHRALQRWGSSVVRSLSGTEVADATSGFRAFSRRAACHLFVHNRFTYTLETIIHGGRSGLVFEDVTVVTNARRRDSRLFKSIPHYLRRGIPVLLRAYVMYQPVQAFALLAAALFVCGAVLETRFGYFYLTNPLYNGHQQSLVVGVGCTILSFAVALLAILSDLLAANRRLLEDVLARLRRLDAHLGRDAREAGERLEGIESTGAAPWRSERGPERTRSVATVGAGRGR
ncbi:MAG: glycosyltransferase family 2 protein [Myxococcota bacterium]|nr:glycosyltransferase family 2 protein [Myxococcota bacterium]